MYKEQIVQIQLSGSAEIITALLDDSELVTNARNITPIEPVNDIATHAFDLSPVASVIAEVPTAFLAEAFVGIILRALERTRTNGLYIKTPSAEIMLGSSRAEDIEALTQLVKHLPNI